MSRHHNEKDKKRVEQDKLQVILNRLLKEEENKYCADCEAKGPRWASWNLGVFLCIRCAGIHRNLGVHLSKVKSVNLDTWTAEQVQHMRVMGNSVGKAVYEASLPDHFRRPQTDSALEAFIRGKYEHKRYIMKDYVPTKIDVRDLLNSDEFQSAVPGGNKGSTGGDEKTGGKGSKKITLTLDSKPAAAQSKRDSGGGKDRSRRKSSSNQDAADGKASESHSASVATALNDLVDLDLGGPSTNWATASTPNLTANVAASDGLDDLFGPIVSNPGPQLDTTNGQPIPNSGSNNGLSELNQDLLIGSSNGGASADAGTKKTKTDILALYGAGGGNAAQQAQAPMMANTGFGAPPVQQMPFSGVQGQTMNFNMNMPASAWTMNQNPGAYGNIQQAQLLTDQMIQQQTAPGFVATPFGYVPVAQAQPQVGSFSQFPTPAPPTTTTSNLHLQAVQQQLASLQLQRSQVPQQQQQASISQQQDTLANNLWH